MKLKLSALSLSIMALAAAGNAQAIELNGTVSVNVPTVDARGNEGFQPVTLLRLKLSKEELKALNGPRRVAASRQPQRDDSLPQSAEVGAIDKVLNQGRHGSCVTFATTGALDALIGKGDYVSQLCSLELGSYLEKRSYTYSGWEGSFGPLVLDQLMMHGIVSTDTQKTKGCAGVTKYPVFTQSDTGNPMSLDEYHELSEKLTFDSKSSTYFYWEPILVDSQYDFKEYDADKVMHAIKQNLATKLDNREVRLTFATILPHKMCSVGACGTYHKHNDTWALTKSMDREFSNEELGGHEMMIIGYDDNAVVTDNEGGTHVGVFKLRNSWGASAGDQGNYYITYDFFRRFASAAERVVKVTRTVDQSDDQQ